MRAQRLRLTVCTVAATHLLAVACTTQLEAPPGADGKEAVGLAAGAEGIQAVHARPPADALVVRGTVRVVAGGTPVASARVASRTAAGEPLDVGVTDAAGVAHVRVIADGVVVAAAPGFAAGARRGAGEVRLVSLDAPEEAVARRDGARVVAEVVRAANAGERALPRAAGLAAAPSSSLPSPRFTDVASHPAAPHIDALASRGVIAGDPDGRFRPDDVLRRAELVALVLRTAGIADAPPDADADAAAFVDVESTAWYAAPVSTARDLGVVAGDPDGRFRPRDAVTRAELASVLVRTGLLPVVAGPAPPDVDDGHWARRAIVTARAWCRLLDVDRDGAFRADVPATRAETAVALSRLSSCVADRGIGSGTLLARSAADGARATFERHHRLLARTGLGSHYGDESPFHRLSLNDKRAFVAARARPGSTPLDPTVMTRSSCVEYAMSLTAAGFGAVGGDAAWQAVDEATRAGGLRGTQLAAELVAQGWRAIYLNPDTQAPPVGDDNEHAYSLAVARARQTYYDVPLSGAFVDWQRDEARQRAMDALSFGVVVLRGGFHVVAIADGLVHELARSEGPDGHVIYDDAWSGIIDVYADEVYGGGADGLARARAMWGSGVLVVPPGVELDGVVGL